MENSRNVTRGEQLFGCLLSGVQRNTELEEVVQHGTQASGWGCCGFLSLGLFLTQRFD